MHHFYSTDISDETIRLSEEESRHCTKVMRLSIGDDIVVFDGVGGKYHVTITNDKKNVEGTILRHLAGPIENRFKLTIAVSPTKSSDRMEWMLEKLIEIGLAKIVFIKTEKGERSRLNEKRLYKKAVSAMKQSGNLWLPEIVTEVPYSQFVKEDKSDLKLIAHCFEEKKKELTGEESARSVTIMIGPEGDFSTNEISLANEYNFQPTSLGLSRLRTETAAVVACTLLNHFNVTLSK